VPTTGFHYEPDDSHTYLRAARQLSRYSDSLRAGRSGLQTPGGGDVFRTHPDLPRGPQSLLHNEYRVSFPGVKRLKRGVNHPPHLAPRLYTGTVITLPPFCAFLAYYRVTFTFTQVRNIISSRATLILSTYISLKSP
jgi:hypothetical protein